MPAFIGAYLRFLYNLRRHRWAEIPLNTWLIILLLLIAILAIAGVIPGSQPLAALGVALVAILIISQWRGKRRDYVHFVADKIQTIPEDQAPIWPQDKMLLHATGLFSVEGREGRFTNLIAYYRTFETREHAIMARVTPSRLFVATTPPDELGMWYIFMEPHRLKAVTSGGLHHGIKPMPSLRLDYIRLNKKGKPVPAIAYLCFDSAADQARVQADLQQDIGGPPHIPWRPAELVG